VEITVKLKIKRTVGKCPLELHGTLQWALSKVGEGQT